MSTPIDVSKLDPSTIAQHLSKPEGAVGVAVAANMNRTNIGAYRMAGQKLALQANDRLLEVGFGNGHEIDALLAAAPGIRYTGIDFSETMVKEAAACNAGAVSEGRVALMMGSASALPFPAAGFDKALALNTIYFWPDPSIELAEIRRVLCPGGRLVLGSNAPGTMTQILLSRGFRTYSKDELTQLLINSGFQRVEIDTLTEDTVTVTGEVRRREHYVTTAHVG
jgi:ubiquinone/menaquinone biosynthesis C-methylase UbiE